MKKKTKGYYIFLGLMCDSTYFFFRNHESHSIVPESIASREQGSNREVQKGRNKLQNTGFRILNTPDRQQSSTFCTDDNRQWPHKSNNRL